MLDRKPFHISLTLLGFALSGSAVAADWSDFEDSFSASPCPDGWLGCVIDGDQINSGLVEQGGVPTPADLRIAWFDLEPTATFSPFTALSDYSGVSVPEPEPEPEPENTPEPETDTEAVVASNSSGGATSSSSGSRPPSSSSGSAETSSSGSSASSSGTSSSSGTTSSGGSRPTENSSSGATSSSGGSRPASSSGGSRPETSSGGSSGTLGGSGTKPTEPVKPTEKPTEEKPTATARQNPAQTDNSCDNLKSIEPKAMLGKLSKGQEECLEGRFENTTVQTEKDKISRVLMTNAYSSWNMAKWERLIKRHLDEVDRSDPNLSYKYAQYLKKQGVGRAQGALRWADVALEQKHLWSGSNYVNKVYQLYKLKATVAQKLWMAAEKKHQAGPTPDTQKAVENAKNKTKVAARDWYDYAREAKKDTTVALQLCSSAAGTKDYCQGG